MRSQEDFQRNYENVQFTSLSPRDVAQSIKQQPREKAARLRVHRKRKEKAAGVQRRVESIEESRPVDITSMTQSAEKAVNFRRTISSRGTRRAGEGGKKKERGKAKTSSPRRALSIHRDLRETIHRAVR